MVNPAVATGHGALAANVLRGRLAPADGIADGRIALGDAVFRVSAGTADLKANARAGHASVLLAAVGALADAQVAHRICPRRHGETGVAFRGVVGSGGRRMKSLVDLLPLLGTVGDRKERAAFCATMTCAAPKGGRVTPLLSGPCSGGHPRGPRGPGEPGEPGKVGEPGEPEHGLPQRRELALTCRDRVINVFIKLPWPPFLVLLASLDRGASHF